jgi:predicted MFS family arabinose efflux permease
MSWRWIFFVNVPVGAAALVLTALKVVESRAEKASRPDWAGFVTFSAALAFLVYGLIESGRAGFSDGAVLGCFGAAAVLLIAFVVVEARIANPMFDLKLFRLPTFVGGDIAAFGMSAGMFSMLLYLVLYLQDILGFSALQSGTRLLLVSAGVLGASAISGRLSVKVPVRFLIGPGLLLIGLGLILMRGLTAASDWSHLIPGLVIGGVGVGLVNPPLASTAVGVVQPSRAGMASGINSTFRQVGIATGIALLGTLLANRLTTAVTALAAHTPLAPRSSQISEALRNGGAEQVFATTPPAQRPALGGIVRGAFTTALNEILLVAAITCFAAGVLALVLIRTKDFVKTGPQVESREPGGAGGTESGSEAGSPPHREQAQPE